MPTQCPVCGQEHPYAREALRCWLGHDPDMPLKYTLQAMGDALNSLSRERVRQLLKKLGETRRRGNLPPDSPARGLTNPEKRRRYYREYEKTPHRKEYKREYRKRRHKERLATDPAYRERMKAKWRAQYVRRKQRRLQHASLAAGQDRSE